MFRYGKNNGMSLLKFRLREHIRFGQIFAVIQETSLIEHRLLVPKNVSGEIVMVKPNGTYNMEEVLIQVKDSNNQLHDLTMIQKWPDQRTKTN